ncbi:hypothetical protein MTR67_032585 [Solanum verrucosum]|uniref:FBD domain-containing protein n=1 Tax=Solanum verrucosum TaxID=315347 RepID=A0AAF0ZI38_SOLVR|nr:hypothetical protein MTR67_032585 [Solanum verrucosum]
MGKPSGPGALSLAHDLMTSKLQPPQSIFFVAIEKSTISGLQRQIPSSSIGFSEMARTRNTELAEALDTKDLATFCFQTLNTLSWTRPYEFDADEYWNMVDSPVQCLTHHLKKVVVAGHVMKKQVIQFLEYLFEHFVVLEEMKIFAEKQVLTFGPINFFNDESTISLFLCCSALLLNPSDLFA